MTAKLPNLQDEFLNAVRRSHIPVSLFVLKGVKLHGTLAGFDPFALILRRDGADQIIYKHSITTVMPGGPLDGFHPSAPAAGASMQDEFLAKLAEAHQPLTIFLVNGVMLDGDIIGFDRFSLILRRERLIQLVYKHAISTIQPASPRTRPERVFASANGA